MDSRVRIERVVILASEAQMSNSHASAAKHMLAATTSRAREATALLETLVGLDTASRVPDNLRAASPWIEARMRELGFAVERRDSAEFGPTLVGRLTGRGTHRVLLLAHYDTVFEAGEATRRPYRSDGQRAYGPGVADMKGGVVVVWEALRALRAAGWDDFKTVTLIHNPDEEIGSPSSRALIEQEGRAADLCLVHEPGRARGEVVVARKGFARFTLTVHGKAAHAGSAPQDGASAVVALSRKIVALHGLNDYTGGLTVNSIVTSGGSKANIAPDRAVAEIDVRIPTMAAGEQGMGQIAAIAGANDLAGTRGELSGGIDRPPFEQTERSARLLTLARDAASALGIPLPEVTSGGVSDGNFVAALGVPVLDGLGACGAGYHSPDEFLLLETIPQRAALSAMLLQRACEEEGLRR
jgi:glutamate carboxypeptidase